MGLRSISASNDDGMDRGTQLTAAVNIGPLQLSASRSVSVSRLIAASMYNRHLNRIVKTYGELDSMRVEFAHGRDLLNWEIGMFCTYASPQDALSIVARHILHDTLSRLVEDDEDSYTSSSSSSAKHLLSPGEPNAVLAYDDYIVVLDRLLNGKHRSPHRPTKPVIGISSRLPNVLVSIPLHSLPRAAFARLAAAKVVHKLRRPSHEQAGPSPSSSKRRPSQPRVALSDKRFVIRYYDVLADHRRRAGQKKGEAGSAGSSLDDSPGLIEVPLVNQAFDDADDSSLNRTVSAGIIKKTRRVSLYLSTVHLEVRADKCLVSVSDAASTAMAHRTAASLHILFDDQLDWIVRHHHQQVPKDYMRAIEASLARGVSFGDTENEARFRAFLQTRRSFQRDSSTLYHDEAVLHSLRQCQAEWNTKRELGRNAKGDTPKEDTSVYHMIKHLLQQRRPSNRRLDLPAYKQHGVRPVPYADSDNVRGGGSSSGDITEDDDAAEMSAMFTGKHERLDELSVFASVPDMISRSGSSIERLWVGKLFESEDTKTIGWIKRRKKMTFVETFTEYFVVMPVERRVVAWTKKSYYNSLQVPWKSHVRSKLSLPALSSICLLSACVYPAPRDQPNEDRQKGDAVLDRELFEDNVRNAGKGIGYALNRLPDEHREAQLRQSGLWSQAPLKLGSFITLVYDLLGWLDSQSKAWVVRETLTLLASSDVVIVVHPQVSATLISVMYQNTSQLSTSPSFSSSTSRASSSSVSSSSTSSSSSTPPRLSSSSWQEDFRNANGHANAPHSTHADRGYNHRPDQFHSYDYDDYDNYDYDYEYENQATHAFNHRKANRQASRLPLPAVLVDVGIPADGIYLFQSRRQKGEFIQTRDSGDNWRYRRLGHVGSRKVVVGKKRQAVELPVDEIEDGGLSRGEYSESDAC